MKFKGALGPGQMLAVDMKKGKLFRDTEIKDKLARALPFGEWVGKINELDDELAVVTEAPIHTGAELRRRQIAAGYTPSRSWNRSLRRWARTAKRRLRQHGRRYALGGVVQGLPPAEPLSSGRIFQPGDQPAD